MFKIAAIIVLVFATYGGCVDDASTITDNVSEDGSRQRRLLFYDEDGNLVKTYSNPYLNSVGQKMDGTVFWNLMNPFFSFLRPSTFGGSTIAYMIPVSDAVVQQINNDPIYQNKLLILSTRDPIVEANPLCNGKREPIPSPKMCSNFLNCWDGWAFEQECPDGLMFSNNGYCDYTYNVDCRNRKLKDTIEPRCHQDFETFRNESDCNEFFICVHSLPVKFKCPADLYFNQHLGICDYQHLVSCNTSWIPTTVTSSPPSETTTASYLKDPTPTTMQTPSVSTTSKTNSILINSMFNRHTWTSSHIAVSRQDAIRQLKLQSIADVKTA